MTKDTNEMLKDTLEISTRNGRSETSSPVKTVKSTVAVVPPKATQLSQAAGSSAEASGSSQAAPAPAAIAKQPEEEQPKISAVGLKRNRKSNRNV